LAVLYDDGSVVFYPNKDDAAPRTLRLAGPPPGTIAFSPDAGRLVGVAVGGAVRVTDVATGSGLDMEPNADCAGAHVRFSAEGDYVLAWDRSLCVWQSRDGVLVTQLAGDFLSAAMTNGRILTEETGAQPNVKSWSLSGGDSLPVVLDPLPEDLPPEDPYYGVSSIEISPRGDSFAASNSSDGMFRLWSADGKLVVSWRAGGEPIYSESGALVLLGGEVFDVASQGHWANTAVDDHAVSSIDETGLWVGGVERLATRAESGDPGARRVFGSLPAPSAVTSDLPTSISFSPDGTRLATSTIRGALLWRVASDFSASVPIRSVGGERPMEAAFSSTSGELVVSGDGGAIYSSGDGAERDQLSLPSNQPSGCIFWLASISPTGRWVTIGGTGATATVLARPGLQSVIALPTEHCGERASFNADETLLALPGPELYRTSDWSLIWPARIVSATTTGADIFRDVQFAPGEKALLVSHCADGAVASNDGCSHALYATADGTLIQSLPALTATRARFSAEGNWIVSGNTALHVPTSESVTFDPAATLSTFAPNGDIVAILNDNTIARYCRTP
jgi:WD40 repeat protein